MPGEPAEKAQCLDRVDMTGGKGTVVGPKDHGSLVGSKPLLQCDVDSLGLKKRCSLTPNERVLMQVILRTISAGPDPPHHLRSLPKSK